MLAIGEHPSQIQRDSNHYIPIPATRFKNHHARAAILGQAASEHASC
jgi:hypothetical protein